MEQLKNIKFSKFFRPNTGLEEIPEGEFVTGVISTGKKTRSNGKYKQETVSFLLDGKLNTGIDTKAKYNVTGYYKNSNYGNQLIVQRMEMVLDTKSLQGLEQALKLIMTPLMAGRVVEHFGSPEKVIEAFENKYSKEFMEVKGMSEDKLDNYYDLFEEKILGQEAILKLTPLGFTPTQAKDIYKKYKDMDIIMEMLENAGMYDFYLDGVLKLREAEIIGRSMNIDKLNEKRIGSIIVDYFKNPFQDDSFLTYEQMDTYIVHILIDKCGDGLNRKHYNSALNYLHHKGITHQTDKELGMKYVYDTEFDVYSTVSELNKNLKKRVNFSDKIIAEKIQSAPFELSEEQIEAVNIVCKNGISILSGNAGAGKSTTLGTVTKVFSAMGYSIEQVALSGKAALRIKETTGLPAQTIHRMFSKNTKQNDEGFRIVPNIDNPYADLSDVEFHDDVLILDEASMVGGAIMSNLLKLLAKSDVKHVVIVGDDAQLPPIGTGQVFTDLLNYSSLPKMKLTRVYRQASESGILAAATNIRQHESFIPHLDKFGHDFKYLTSAKGPQIVEEFDRMLKRNNGDILETQIIAMKNIEVAKVNNAIQKHLKIESSNYFNNKVTSNSESVKFKIYEGSKVMLSENQYETLTAEGEEGGQPVFNGNIGIVKQIFEDYMVIDFAGIGEVGILRESCFALRLGYAITIHKSQGSGFKSVIALVSDGAQHMLTSNMLYTAITRSKEECTLVSREHVVSKCALTNGNERQTWLAKFYGGKK